jgi:hypothetical protein
MVIIGRTGHMQVVYIDTLFLINFTVNYLMLLLTAKICSVPARSACASPSRRQPAACMPCWPCSISSHSSAIRL